MLQRHFSLASYFNIMSYLFHPFNRYYSVYSTYIDGVDCRMLTVVGKQ